MPRDWKELCIIMQVSCITVRLNGETKRERKEITHGHAWESPARPRGQLSQDAGCGFRQPREPPRIPREWGPSPHVPRERDTSLPCAQPHRSRPCLPHALRSNSSAGLQQLLQNNGENKRVTKSSRSALAKWVVLA